MRRAVLPTTPALVIGKVTWTIPLRPVGEPEGMAGMTGWREPQEPTAIPKAIRLRERVRALMAQAEGLPLQTYHRSAESNRRRSNDVCSAPRTVSIYPRHHIP